MRGYLPSGLPYAFNRIELWAVWRQAVQLDLVRVVGQPLFACIVEPMTGAVVEDHEDLSRPMALHDGEQELVERVAIEHISELVDEGSIIYRNRAKHVGGLALSVGGNSGLDAYGRPCLMQSAIEPEARFVLKHDDAPAFGRFFLIAGSRTSTHCRCASASARASNLRGR